MLKTDVIIVVAVFGVALGALSNASPSPCCYPDQFQSGISEINTEYDESTGVASAIRVSVRAFVDISNKTAALFRFDRSMVNFFTNQRSTATILSSGGMLHIFNDTHCRSLPIQPEFGCITDSARFLGTSYSGLGDNRLVTHTWRMESGNETRVVGVTDNCVPVSFDTTGRQGNGICFVVVLVELI